MHIHRRLHVIVAISLVVVPLSTLSLIGSLSEKYEAIDELNQALDDAAVSYRSGNGLHSLLAKREEALVTVSAALDSADAKKREARLKVVEADRIINQAQRDYAIDTATGALAEFVESEGKQLVAFARYIHTQKYASAPEIGVSVIRQMFHMSLGELTDLAVRDRAIERARLRVFAAALKAKRAQAERPALMESYIVAMEEYEKAWDDYRGALDAVEAAKQRIEDVRRTTEEVHAEVLRLQGELARIDARLKAKLERELIEKGLMDAKPGERSDGRVRAVQSFRWPVIGRVTAGFLNEAYEAFFGVPHRGMDIAVAHGSPVYAAADGIVFLARDGGATGYSYILIGHRDGYATLYGHLSSFAVSTGDEVTSGQAIGLSGGTPGTYGAGPMTTGPHLHFEVIRNGAHVDPKIVLK